MINFEKFTNYSQEIIFAANAKKDFYKKDSKIVIEYYDVYNFDLKWVNENNPIILDECNFDDSFGNFWIVVDIS